MKRLDRHDYILIARRKRHRVEVNRPRPWLWAGQGIGAILTTLLITFGIVVGLAVVTIVSVYNAYARQLPDVSAIETQQDRFQTVRIYDRTGKQLLYESVDPRPFRGDRTFMALNKMSPWTWKAAVALEDRNFFDNPGVNVRGLFRALASNLQGSAVQGGSSITQQLVKNVVIPPEERAQQSYARKLKEVVLAMEVTRRYPKDKILEWYLNYNGYGNLAYGVEAASKVYFGKTSKDLTLAEAAMLAPIPQFPILNPINNLEEAKQRQGLALQAMVEAGYITSAQADVAFHEPLALRKSVAERFDVLTAPHFALYVLDQIKELYNTAEDPYLIWRNGLKIYTTLDVDLQKYTEQVAREQVKKLLADGKNGHNAAVTAIKNDTGEILAMVGSLDYNNDEIDGQINMATAPRQPGSSFKPYVYLTALEKRMTAASMILDVPTALPQSDGKYYRPENYDNQYHGPVSIRNALARSYNIPAIRVLKEVGIADALRTAHSMGINGLDRGLDYYGLNLVLGGGEVSLLDHTFAYSVFANKGVMLGEPILPDQSRPGFRNLNPVSVLQIVDSDGNILKKYQTPQTERIFSAEAAYVMADIMSDDVARAPSFGANSDVTLPDRKVAAKTGTTNQFKDNWTMGFTPQLTVGVWVGNSDNESMKNVTGLSGAAPIWNAIMRKYHENLPVLWYDRPPGIVNLVVCTPSGLLPSPSCPGSNRRDEIFIAGTEPKIQDNVWQALELDKATGKLATATTPADRREFQVYEILPQEAADWVRESGLAQPPTELSAGSAQDFDPNAAIMSPLIGSYLNGVREIKGNARGGPYKVDFGQGTDPQQWTQIGPDHTNEVVSGTLESLDTGQLAEGAYTLRLTVNRGDGAKEVRTPINVDHTPPTVIINDPQPNRLYVMEDDEQININALVDDNWAVDHVDYYMDGARFSTSTVSPYNDRWKIRMRDIEQIEVDGTQNWQGFASQDADVQPGRVRPFSDGFSAIRTSRGVYFEGHTVKVIAYDRAGNAATSAEVLVYIRHKKETTKP